MRDKQFTLNKIFEECKQLPKIIEHLTIVEDFKSDLVKEKQDLRKQFEELENAFKNFHKNLCDATGYAHDEKDWSRDQASLIEYIRNYIKETKNK